MSLVFPKIHRLPESSHLNSAAATIKQVRTSFLQTVVTEPVLASFQLPSVVPELFQLGVVDVGFAPFFGIELSEPSAGGISLNDDQVPDFDLWCLGAWAIGLTRHLKVGLQHCVSQ